MTYYVTEFINVFIFLSVQIVMAVDFELEMFCCFVMTVCEENYVFILRKMISLLLAACHSC